MKTPPPPEAVSDLPEIPVNDQQLKAMTDSVLKSLVRRSHFARLYVRSRKLVRLRTDKAGGPIAEVLSDSALRGIMAESARFYRQNGKYSTSALPPISVVNDIQTLAKWPFPDLDAIVEIPVLRPDGSVLENPGYDPATRLYYYPASGLTIPPVPEHPSPEEQRAALELLNECLGEFPYDTQPSRANAIAVLLTPIVRPSIEGCVPLALLDAPQQGSGKSLLAKVVSGIATGREAAFMAAPNHDDEWRKKITATLKDGATIQIIDNIDGRLCSPSLAMAFTTTVWRDRILGKSESIELPQRATWIATGNNIRVGGDLQRRCYWIRLDAKSSTPWLKRVYKHPDLLLWAKDNRGKLVAALLTLTRAWFSAGCPAGGTPILGSFEGWSKTVGGILAHAGVKGFLGNLGEMYGQADEEAAEWEEFYQALQSRYGSGPFTTANLIEDLTTNAALAGSLPDDLAGEWHNPKSRPNFSKKLGKALSTRQSRRYGSGEHRVEVDGKLHGAQKWKIVSTPEPVAA